MRIKQRANNLAKKFRTRDPFEIAAYLNIEVFFQPMNRTKGFCNRILRRKFIVINSRLSEHLKKQTCAHELGHIVLHKGWGYYFMLEHTLYSPGKFERQANEFAWWLLYDKEYCAYAYNGDLERYAKEEGFFELTKYMDL
ncbi:ImmA/IrrE family metallo-endopeptidase [Sporomusa paucivorans]|uniref:ImmA/IrrE family metallo-endopeptidase n=1 Tax=Sporomusa paucivorans TaxID=2376 RepID=UPI0035711201